MQAPAPARRAVLTFRPGAPLDARQTLARYGRWGVDPASPYHDGTLYRVACLGDALVPFRLSVAGPPAGPRATLAFAGPDTPAVRQALRREAAQLLGETWDLAGFYAAAALDPVLGPFVRPSGALFGLRPTLVTNPFEMLVGAISAQQVNLRWAGWVPWDSEVPEAVRRQQPVIELAPSTPATRAIDGLAERICAAPSETKAKGGLQFFFRRLLAGEQRVGAAH